MDERLSNSAHSAQDFNVSGIIQPGSGTPDGARLIAPSIPCEGIPIYSLGKETNLKEGFAAGLNGAYPLNTPVLDIEGQVIYSVDMVRLEFWHDNQQQLIDAIDKQMVFATCDTFTSNRIGSYRFMWTFDYANGKDGGYEFQRGEETYKDGDKGIVVKVGYGVVSKGGKANNKGFVEFNPNKCEVNARKFINVLYGVGCIFQLKRFDLAIDYSIPRQCVRLLRDRRKYEYVLSSKGGATEYLGTRNSPGRVKVYDKAGEQDLDLDLTRVELTCAASWSIQEIVEHLPICNDFSRYKGDGILLALCSIISDMLLEKDDAGKPTTAALETVPERYWQLLAKNTRYKVKKVLKGSQRVITYKPHCIDKCVSIANSFVIT